MFTGTDRTYESLDCETNLEKLYEKYEENDMQKLLYYMKQSRDINNFPSVCLCS